MAIPRRKSEFWREDFIPWGENVRLRKSTEARNCKGKRELKENDSKGGKR